jgi:hypothetical protein
MMAALAALLVAAVGAIVSGHELYLRPRGFFVAPHATVTIPVLNGTFGASENAVARERLADLTLAGPAGRRPLDRTAWTAREPRSSVRVAFGGPGTYVVAASTAARTLRLDGPAFDRYLADEGIAPILARRRAAERFGQAARESYAKAAKTLVAVTDAGGHVAGTASTTALRPLGYDAEIVPLVDPYAVGVGGVVTIRALVDGRPLAGWTVLAGGTVGTSTTAIPLQTLTTDADGRAAVRLTDDGHWFVRFVFMREARPDEGVDYVSRWATLTFGVLPSP